ncbi:hypothetical protein PENSUB_814 [Penicillium subrubescens]|uniref:Uncharacterized protein n=1 Tax=Penicillium subrubescens TaxID=1316194 RepID=A0A1Q5UME3_9EURO|nr:hypothetical protein PENSUB_814 [Penicillium subrubescens]
MMMMLWLRLPQRDLRFGSRGFEAPIKEGENKPEPSRWVSLSSVIVTQNVLGLAIVDGWDEWEWNIPEYRE